MKKYKVIVSTDLSDAPRDHEMSAALILAHHFKTDVTFLRPQTRKTPDIDVDGIKWEIKSPKGNSKKTIENNLRLARRQSRYIVLDLTRSKIHTTKAVAKAKFYIRTEAHSVKHLKIITKAQKIIDIL